jgi:hypothetical protein
MPPWRNRHGLAVAGMVTHANGTAERCASEIMLKAKSKAAGRRITVGEDKAYDTADHVANLRAINVTPHVTQNNGLTKTGKTRKSAIDERTTRHPGYGMPQSRRAMTECIFGWGKQHGTMRKTKHHSCRRRLHAQSDRLQPDPPPETDGRAANPGRSTNVKLQKSSPNPYATRKRARERTETSISLFFSELLTRLRLRPTSRVKESGSDRRLITSVGRTKLR